jgi:uncharacterized protein YdaU (DUF1376 family)
MYWGDYFADTTHLTTEEHGAYLLLLGVYWRRGCGLPDDDEYLRKVTKFSKYGWAKSKNILRAFFKISDGVWTHERVEIEILRSSGRLNSARANGRAGGLAKLKLVTVTVTKDKEKKEGRVAFAPPDWVPLEAWAAFEEMRTKIKKPMTDRARSLIVGKLEAMGRDGHEPGAVLLQSVEHAWQTIYPLKGQSNETDIRGSRQQPTKTDLINAAARRAAAKAGCAPAGYGGEAKTGRDADPMLQISESLWP